MNPDERTLLTNFLRDLVSTRGPAKDPEADGLIHQALAANPDAAYLLVQHTIVADQSLHAAQARIADLETQLRAAQGAQAPQSSGGFLSQPSPWGSAQQGYGASQSGYGAGQSGYGQQPQYSPPPPAERPGIFSGGGGLGSFLRTAGTTAAGVAGGEMLFSGLSDIFGGHRGGGGFGGGGGYDRPENVTINNYNDDGDDDDNDDDNSDDSDN